MGSSASLAAEILRLVAPLHGAHPVTRALRRRLPLLRDVGCPAHRFAPHEDQPARNGTHLVIHTWLMVRHRSRTK